MPEDTNKAEESNIEALNKSDGSIPLSEEVIEEFGRQQLEQAKDLKKAFIFNIGGITWEVIP